MHFLGSLGVDLGLLFAQVVNFVFLLWLLSKFVYRPLVAKIEADEANLAEVKKAQEALSYREVQLDVLEKRHSVSSKKQAKLIIAEAEEIATAIKKNARTEVAQEKKKVIAQINQRLAEVSHEEN